MENDICLDFIIELIKVHKTEADTVCSGDTRIRGTHYLLGQIIRQYAIPDANHYVSVAAMKLWSELSDENIWNYVYTNTFVCKKDVSLPKYVGSEKKPRETANYSAGDKIQFKSVFHDEHIISVQEILRQLDAIPASELNHENVKRILDSIVICRILKSEDKNLPHVRKPTFEENYELIYKTNGVELINDADSYSKRTRKDL